MTITNNFAIDKAFEAYRDTLSLINNHLNFWSHILKKFITEYEPGETIMPLFQALFTAYDYNSKTQGKGNLVTHHAVFSINKTELETERQLFFLWIMDLSILKAYNAAELFLLQAVALNYFPGYANPAEGKEHADRVHAEILNLLKGNGIKPDKKNNRHIIQFIKWKSPKAALFLNETMNSNFATTWERFFELFSILRNLIVHNSLIVSRNTHNNIKGTAGDVFEKYFTLNRDEYGYDILQPIENSFDNFIVHINDFVLNTIKYISGEETLEFLGMTDIFEFYGVFKNK